MNIRDAFPSKYFRAGDIDRPTTLTIREVRMEQVGRDNPETKPVVYFDGGPRGLVLNKSNAERLWRALGADTAGWIGQKVILTTAPVFFQGREVSSIQATAAAPAAAAPAAAPKPAEPLAWRRPAPKPAEPLPAGALDATLDDEIPF